MKKYTFSFKEVNYGSVVINSDHTPDRGEVIDTIMNGNAYIKGTEYEDINLVGNERIQNPKERSYER